MTSRAAILPPQTVFGPARSTLTLDMASLDTSALSPALTTDDSSQLVIQEKKTLEQKEEEKLKAKYPNLRGGGPAILHKRLIQKGKYFDSGDYNMAKAAMNNPKKPLPPQEKILLQESIGEGIPTPEDLPPRKPSIVQSKLASGALS
ncbi:cAMP-regulated phosphoprotein 19-like isoform X2 [Pomacea canaliculata]|uniref:cAMP-regulated phosphoprotein 19-like isoform X2 n=1 Tax=Pomacea canaliculata TaxID=400727 RepID=UPI000D73FEEB|nr:cAMP-regulated phosphoprotein 19-like isoform X2 [Pomacea canaliculata]